MEKIVIFALVILSCVALSSTHSHTMTMDYATTASVMPTSHNTTGASTTVSTTATTAAGPTSGAVSFTASAGLVVSLVMALLH